MGKGGGGGETGEMRTTRRHPLVITVCAPPQRDCQRYARGFTSFSPLRDVAHQAAPSLYVDGLGAQASRGARNK